MNDPIIEKFGDYGAESSRRDEFQKHYAAYWCIEMLFDETITEVICEYGEDIVLSRNEEYELHQVKTRQESRDDWKLEELVPIVAKTFAMAPYFGTVTKCCFISNQGAKGILLELKNLLSKNMNEWNDKDKDFFEEFCKNHANRIHNEVCSQDPDNNYSVDDICQRLLILDIKTEFHHMEYIQDSNMRRLRRAIENNIEERGIPLTDDEISEVYERLMGLVGKATIGKSRLQKTITKQLVLDCIKISVVRKTLYRIPTEDEIKAVPGTKLEQKLSLGGFTPEFIETAREIMVETIHTTKTWEFGLSESLFDDVKFRVKYFCIDSFDKICQSNPTEKRIGRKMLDELKKEFPNLENYYKESNIPVDSILLLGMAWILTSECKVYWSQERLNNFHL